MDDNGRWWSKESDIAEIFVKYYANLFQSPTPSVTEIEAAIANILPTVDEAMNDILNAPYTDKEIQKAFLICIRLKLLVRIALRHFSSRKIGI